MTEKRRYLCHKTRKINVKRTWKYGDPFNTEDVLICLGKMWTALEKVEKEGVFENGNQKTFVHYDSFLDDISQFKM